LVAKRILLIGAIIAVALVATGTTFALYQSGLIFRASPTSGKLQVLATFYPQYDFTQNIGGDRISLSLLVPMTVDVHAFEPTPSSIQQVANARVLIYNGAGLEPWITQVVNAAGNSNLLLVNASQGIPLIPVPAQFQREGRIIDPHVWLDPVLAKQQVNNILQALIRVDPADQAYFTANAQVYNSKLDNLNSQIINATTTTQTRKFVTFHEAFGYFANRYNLIQIPIAGPFEEEPTPSDIQNVVDVVNQNHLCVVGYESLENPAISQSIASQTHAKLMRMDPIEGLSQSDQVLGKTYLIKMGEDLSVISFALNNANC
jgi:zinc transport system substrate-binding protein